MLEYSNAKRKNKSNIFVPFQNYNIIQNMRKPIKVRPEEKFSEVHLKGKLRNFLIGKYNNNEYNEDLL